jgi:hypothetical protein
MPDFEFIETAAEVPLINPYYQWGIQEGKLMSPALQAIMETYNDRKTESGTPMRVDIQMVKEAGCNPESSRGDAASSNLARPIL